MEILCILDFWMSFEQSRIPQNTGKLESPQAECIHSGSSTFQGFASVSTFYHMGTYININAHT